MNGQSLIEAFVPLPAGATAAYVPSGIAYYRHAGWLGSTRLVSTTSRTVTADLAYSPFGYGYAESGGLDKSFTGHFQDTSSNLYDFMYREYGIEGRWPSPDPLDTGAFSLADPQSLDLYAYVRNSPESLTDPFGMDTGGGLCTPAPAPQQGYYPGDSIQCPNFEAMINGAFMTDFSAAYGGPPPSATSFVISPYQFINGYSGATYTVAPGKNGSVTFPGPLFEGCAPSGSSLTNSCNAGYLFGKDLTAAEGAYVNYVNKVIKALWSVRNGATGLKFPGGVPGTPALSLPTVLKPTCSVPSVMGQFVQALKNWPENNPNSPIPPWLLMPPAWVVSCAAA